MKKFRSFVFAWKKFWGRRYRVYLDQEKLFDIVFYHHQIHIIRGKK